MTSIELNTDSWDGCKVSMGWTAGTGKMSGLIRSTDRVLFGDKLYTARYNHVFWHFNWQHAPSIVYESHQGAGVQLTPWEYVLNSTKVYEYKLHEMPISPEDAHRLYLECTKLHGAPYDLRHILPLRMWLSRCRKKGLTLNDEHVPKLLKWRLGSGRNQKFICNELVYRTGEKIGLDMGLGICQEVTSSPEILYLAHVGHPSLHLSPKKSPTSDVM